MSPDGSRTTLHKVIKSFLVIFCTYYLVTHIWPMIKRKIALRKEKSAIMAKLLRKQEDISVERVDDVSSKSSSDNKSDVVFSNDLLPKRFDLGHTLQVVNASDNCKVGASAGQPSASLVNETLGIVGSKYNSEGSNRTVLSGKYMMKPTKQLSKTEDKLGDEKLTEKDIAENELEEAEDTSIEMHVTNRGDIVQKTSVQKLTNDELLTKNNSEGNKNLTKLWSHVSRTAPYSTYTTYANSSVDINPWDGRNNLRGISTEEDSSAIGNIPPQNLQSARLTYSEARELRNQQDAEYSSSLAQEELKKRIAKELLDAELSKKLMTEMDVQRRLGIIASLPEEPEIQTDGCLTISFRYRVTTQENEDNLYTSNSRRDVAEMELDDKSITDSTANKSMEKQIVVKRRFCGEEKLSVLLDFVESHDLCPSVFESVAILLFHPKRSYDRNSCEGRLISDDITCDTLVWVEVTV